MGYITPQGLENLKNFKYQTSGYSPVDNVMNAWWLWCVEQLPMWLAPNLVTVIGLVFMMFSYFIMLPFDTTFEKEVPGWILIISVIFQFVNQTLDAVDGKQARRTGSSSPLGMLLDHGSDSLTTTILILTLVQGVALGKAYYLVTSILCIQGVFYFAAWEEYHLKMTRTQIGVFGVTEGQFMHMAVIITSAVAGAGFFHDNYALGFSFAQWTIAGNAAFAILMVSSVMIDNWKKCPNPLQSYLDLLPFVLQQGFLACWAKTSLFDDYTWQIVIVQGFVFSKMVIKLLICACGEQKFSIFHFDLAALYLGFGITQLGFAPEGLTFLAISIFITVDYFIFISDTILTIAKYLGIYVFSTKKRD